jgi:hypothetical protein
MAAADSDALDPPSLAKCWPAKSKVVTMAHIVIISISNRLPCLSVPAVIFLYR